MTAEDAVSKICTVMLILNWIPHSWVAKGGTEQKGSGGGRGCETLWAEAQQGICTALPNFALGR